MSWERVLKSSQAIKAPVLSTMESREFHSAAKRLGELDNCSEILHKDVRQLTERELSAFTAEKKLLTDLCSSAPIRDDPRMRDVLQQWNEYIREQDTNLNSMVNDTNRAMVEPIKRLLSEFPKVREMIRKRDQSLIEYDRCQQKLDKLKKKGRTGANIVKIDAGQKSLKLAKEQFEAENTELLEYMTFLYDQRAEYLTPSIRAFINLQICNIGRGYKFYSELQETVKLSQPVDQTSKLDKLNEIKTLTIVSTDMS